MSAAGTFWWWNALPGNAVSASSDELDPHNVKTCQCSFLVNLIAEATLMRHSLIDLFTG